MRVRERDRFFFEDGIDLRLMVVCLPGVRHSFFLLCCVQDASRPYNYFFLDKYLTFRQDCWGGTPHVQQVFEMDTLPRNGVLAKTGVSVFALIMMHFDEVYSTFPWK